MDCSSGKIPRMLMDGWGVGMVVEGLVVNGLGNPFYPLDGNGKLWVGECMCGSIGLTFGVGTCSRLYF